MINAAHPTRAELDRLLFSADPMEQIAGRFMATNLPTTISEFISTELERPKAKEVEIFLALTQIFCAYLAAVSPPDPERRPHIVALATEAFEHAFAQTLTLHDKESQS